MIIKKKRRITGKYTYITVEHVLFLLPSRRNLGGVSGISIMVYVYKRCFYKLKT